MDRIFSIVPDRSQILLYEKHGLCFVTTVFEICPAYELLRFLDKAFYDENSISYAVMH